MCNIYMENRRVSILHMLSVVYLSGEILNNCLFSKFSKMIIYNFKKLQRCVSD